MDSVRRDNEEAKICFRETMKQQERERNEVMNREMVKVLHEQENLVREMAEKNCIIVSGICEEHNKNWIGRERDEKKRIDDILTEIEGNTESQSVSVRSRGGRVVGKV